MKRTKKIIEALKVITTSPAMRISDAREAVMSALSTGAKWTEDDRTLVDRLLAAIVADAEDMEKPAKADAAPPPADAGHTADVR